MRSETGVAPDEVSRFAWKFLAAGALGPFSGVRWPEPDACGAPGEWVVAAHEHELGVHACRILDLPFWIDEELWEVELRGAITHRETQLVAGAGRLLRRVNGWSETRDAFAATCAFRARALAVSALAADERRADAERLGAAARLEDVVSVARPLSVDASSSPSSNLAGYAAEAAFRAAAGFAAAAGTICADAAAAAAAVDRRTETLAAERAWQARWLAEALALQPR